MRLTNYWYLIIWLFLAGAVLPQIFPKQTEIVFRKKKYVWSFLAVMIIITPYIIWGGYRAWFGDTETYRSSFLNLSTSLSQIPSLFLEDVKDPGFTTFSILIKSIIGNRDELFFLLISAFQMIGLAVIYRKYSTDFFTCLFLFIASTDYLSWVHNGMRQFIAIIMIFHCFKWMVEKKYLPCIFVTVLAAQIHGSAYLMIPIFFVVQGKAWNKRTLLFMAAIMVVVMYMDAFTPLLNDLLADTQYSDLVTNEIWTNDDGTNLIRVLVYSVPALISLVGIRYVHQANNPVINVSVNCSIVTMGLYLVAAVSSGIYIGRLPMYTTLQGYICLPWLIEHMFSRRSARFVKLCMYGFYLAFFYFQMDFIWGLL